MRKKMALLEIVILLVVLGMIFIIVGSFMQSSKDTKVAFGGFIGPFPFGFANDKQLLYVVIAIIAIVVIFWILKQFL
jgi:uncharacterized membrane protein